MRRLLVAVMAITLLAAACGGDDDDDTSTADGAEQVDDGAGATDAGGEGDDTGGDDSTTEGAGGVGVRLSEWEVFVPTELAGGRTLFLASNAGEFPHQFGIARGDSYESLPLLDNGAIDEAALGADLIDKTDAIDPGASGQLNLDLEPGNYVVFCNITSGPNSHAANGMTLSVTVS